MNARLSRRSGRSPALVALPVLWCCLLQNPANAQDVDFYRDLYPILKSNCIACHNKTTTKGGLNMESPEAIRKGGESGEGVIARKSAESLVFQAAARVGDVEMPPKGNKTGALNLTPVQLALFKSWIDQGAKDSVKQAREVTWRRLPPGVHPIYAVAMTRDGRYAACGRANQVFVHDLATRQVITRLSDPSLDSREPTPTSGVAHLSLVQALAFSPDGMRLASGSYRELKIWRREEVPATRRERNPNVSPILSTLSPDGSKLLAVDARGVAWLTETSSGKTIKTITNPRLTNLFLIRLSPDATKLAIQGKDGSLSLVSLDTGHVIASKGAVPVLRALIWTRDGKAIVTGGDDPVAKLWPVPETGKTELAVAREYPGSGGAVSAIRAGTDLLFAASTDGKIRSWNIHDAKPAAELPAPGVISLDLSTDGKRLATGRADGIVEVWDLTTSKPLAALSGDLETATRLAALDETIAGQALEIAFHNQEAGRIDGQNKGLAELLKKANDTIANVKKDLGDKRNALKQAADAREAAAKTAAESASLKEAQDKLAAAMVAEKVALSAVAAREIHLKDAEAEAQNYTAAAAKNASLIKSANEVAAQAKTAQDKAAARSAEIRKTLAERKSQPLAVRFSADSRSVAAVMNDGALRVWAIASGLPVGQVSCQGATALASFGSAGEDGFIASGGDGSTTLIGTSSRWVLERTIGAGSLDSPFADRVNALRFSPDGKTLAAGSGEPTRSGDINLWDIASGRMIAEWKERHSDAILSLDFSPDGKRLASGGADKLARVTDIATGQVVNHLEGHTHHVSGVSFRADGRVLATSGGDGTVVIWDMISGERKRKIEGWSKEVTSLQFLGATNQILASSGDNQVRIVDDNGGQVRAIANLPDFMQAAAAASTADVMAAGGEDGLFRVWTRSSGQELAIFGVESNSKSP